MGTAVLHPQELLAAPQSDRHHRFSCVSESQSRQGGRAISATYEVSIPATAYGRDVTLGNTMLNQGRGLLGRKNSSAGLLPLPDQASQSAHSSFRMLAPEMSPCRSGEIVDPYVSKHLTSSHHSNLSSYASISRLSSVQMLDHAACTQRFFSGCFSLHAVQLHERRLPRHDAKLFLNSEQGYSMAGSSLPCEKLKFLANSHFSDVLNPVRPKWVDCTDQRVHYRKRMHPEVPQVEAYLGRQCAKPSLKVLPDGQGKSICTNTSTIGRKHGVNKQLKRSASEKRQERLEVPILQRPGTKEAANKHTTNLFEGVGRSHNGKCRSSKIEVKLTSSAPPASSLEGKIAKSLQTQASLDADTQGRMRVFTTGVARSSQVTLSQQMGETERNVGASLHGQCYGSVNAAMEQKAVNEGDQITGIAGCVSQDQDDLRKVDVTSRFDNQLARKPETVMGLEGISRSLNSVLDNDGMWVSMMNDERWAGPSFFNSPPPGSLPVPSFTCKFSRTASTVSEPSHMASDNSLLEAKHTWDIAFATKDLRRMLNLDHASCNL